MEFDAYGKEWNAVPDSMLPLRLPIASYAPPGVLIRATGPEAQVLALIRASENFHLR